MGDYVYMQGKAKIQQGYIKNLQAFFNSRHDDPDYELNWSKLVEVEPTLRVYNGYKLLAMTHGMGSERIPFSMSNSTGWPFDDLVDEMGELELDDDGNLTFKCSSRNRNSVLEAFVSLVFMWASDYEIQYDTHEWAYTLGNRDDYTKTYVPGDSEGFDKIMETVAASLEEMERKAELWKLAPMTVEEKQQMRSIGISEAFLESLDGPSRNIVDMPREPALVTEWSRLVNAKLEQMGIPLELFTSSSPRPHESFAEYAVRLGMTRVYKPDVRTQSLTSPKFGQYETLLDHINAHKLFARGKKGIRQVNRKQRRKMKA